MANHKEDWLTQMADQHGLDPEDFLEIAAMFFEKVDERVENIAAAGHAGDIDTMWQLAHGLKGDAANLGFMDISKIARELEQQGKARAVVNFEQQIDALRVATLTTRENLEF